MEPCHRTEAGAHESASTVNVAGLYTFGRRIPNCADRKEQRKSRVLPLIIPTPLPGAQWAPD